MEQWSECSHFTSEVAGSILSENVLNVTRTKCSTHVKVYSQHSTESRKICKLYCFAHDVNTVCWKCISKTLFILDILIMQQWVSMTNFNLARMQPISSFTHHNFMHTSKIFMTISISSRNTMGVVILWYWGRRLCDGCGKV